MKKTFLITLVFVFVFQIAKTQDSTYVSPQNEKQKKEVKDRIYFGGNVGLSFGSYTMIGLYPMVGYKVTDQLSFGGKVAYEYIEDSRYGTSQNRSNYGASIFTRYRIIPPVYLHAEYAGLNYEIANALGEVKREWIPFLFVGGGYSQSLGNRTWLNLQVLFDVLQNENSPYKSWEPFYSVGIGVGF